MAVAKNTGDSGSPKAATVVNAGVTSFSHTGYTIGAGADLVLVATLVFGNATAADISGLAVTWDGVALTRAGTGVVNTGARVEIWTLVNPATGNKTLAASWTTGADCTIGLISFTGAATPVTGDTVTNTGSTSPTTGSVTSSTDGATVGATTNRTASVTATSTQTEIYLDNTNWCASGASYGIGGTANTHSWASAGVAWAAMGIHIPAAATATGGGPLMGGGELTHSALIRGGRVAA